MQLEDYFLPLKSIKCIYGQYELKVNLFICGIYVVMGLRSFVSIADLLLCEDNHAMSELS